MVCSLNPQISKNQNQNPTINPQISKNQNQDLSIKHSKFKTTNLPELVREYSLPVLETKSKSINCRRIRNRFRTLSSSSSLLRSFKLLEPSIKENNTDIRTFEEVRTLRRFRTCVSPIQSPPSALFFISNSSNRMDSPHDSSYVSNTCSAHSLDCSVFEKNIELPSKSPSFL